MRVRTNEIMDTRYNSPILVSVVVRLAVMVIILLHTSCKVEPLYPQPLHTPKAGNRCVCLIMCHCNIYLLAFEMTFKLP